MPGPPPKDPATRRRRSGSAGFTQLPAEGRAGDAPEWPISEPSLDELVIWAELWHTPQAVEWERLGYTRTIARYARLVLEAERPDADTTLRSETRQLEDRLGLSPMSMRRLMWQTAELEPEPVAPAKAKRRVKAVDPALVKEGV